MAQSAIEWTESTWNPVTGCTKISPGCKHCYAERMARRLKAMGQPNYRDGFELTLHEQMLELPLRWKKPQDDLRQLDERPLPRGRPARVHPARVRRDAAGALAPLPGADEARGRLAELDAQPRLAAERLDGRERGDAAPTVSASTTCAGRAPPIRFLSLEPLLGPLPALDLRRHVIDRLMPYLLVGAGLVRRRERALHPRPLGGRARSTPGSPWGRSS